MVIEKCKKEEELIKYTNKIIEVIKDTEDKKILAEIIGNVMLPQLGEETVCKMIEKIKEGEVISMSPLTKMLFDLEIKGKLEGKLEAVKEAVKNMLQFGEPEEKIEKYMGITKEELEKIKGMITN